MTTMATSQGDNSHRPTNERLRRRSSTGLSDRAAASEQTPLPDNAAASIRFRVRKQAPRTSRSTRPPGRVPSATSCGRLTLASTGRSRREVSLRRDDCGSSRAGVSTQPVEDARLSKEQRASRSALRADRCSYSSVATASEFIIDTRSMGGVCNAA